MTKDLSSPDHDQDEPARPGPETRWQHTRQDWPYYSTSRLDHEISFDKQYGPVALA